MNVQHKKNRDILANNGFKITQYINTANRLVLYAKHKDGRKVTIAV